MSPMFTMRIFSEFCMSACVSFVCFFTALIHNEIYVNYILLGLLWIIKNLTC